MLAQAINHAFVPPVYPILCHLAHDLVFGMKLNNTAQRGILGGNVFVEGKRNYYFFLILARNKARTTKLRK